MTNGHDRSGWAARRGKVLLSLLALAASAPFAGCAREPSSHGAVEPVGSIGLNLTAASHVVHFDRWWNPAVENQATDRAFRIGQTKNVLVHKFVCQGTVEEKIDQLMESKRQLAKDVLEGGAELLLTEMNDEQLLKLVALDINKALEEK